MATVRQFLCPSLSLSVFLSASQCLCLSLFTTFFLPHESPWWVFLFLHLPFCSPHSPFHFSCPVNSHHPSALVPYSAPLRSFPPYLHPSYLSSPPPLDPLFTPIALSAPPFYLFLSCLPPFFFSPRVFFCATWLFLPKTQWHLFHCPFILTRCWSQERMRSLKRLLWFLSKPVKGMG